jgi:CheY-like chemotaxis protein
VADDDPDAHEVVALTLRQSGVLVRSFGSGRELVKALEGALATEPPDLLLLDLAMPEDDGFETLRRVRSLELACGIEQPVPAIAFTAFTQVERERLRAAGFVDRVDKPVDADKLIAAIREAAKQRPHAKTGTA